MGMARGYCGWFFPQSEMSAGAYLYLCYDVPRAYNTQVFVILLQGLRTGNISIMWHCSSQPGMTAAVSDWDHMPDYELQQ